ncbi:MAG: hypothetical protein EXS13_08680 [Planctomycetes bacterium]|nr:hypothetical protein [Planctomycetota bacterium]
MSAPETTSTAITTAATSAPPSAPAAPVEPPPPPLRFMQRLHRFTERFGHLMSRVILTVLYIVLVGPAGLVLSLFGDPLRIRRWRGSAWHPWTRTNDTLDLARRQD